MVTIKGVELSHPDKILYPGDGITKKDLFNYYVAVEKWMLPLIINRPLTLLRCPDSYKKCFFQKHLDKTTPDAVKSILVKGKSADRDYVYIKNLSGLLSLVQLGVLEFHAWGCDIKKLEYPSIITFDLDPAENVPWKRVVAAAKLLKQYLLNLNLESFVLSTGGKGLHIVVPIKPEYNWDTIKQFSHALATLMVTDHPKEFIATASKAKRKGKIFIDYLRNQRGATAIVPYSTRARAGAPVAVPLEWSELNHDKHIEFNTETVIKRLNKMKKNPWKDFLTIKQSLKKILNNA